MDYNRNVDKYDWDRTGVSFNQVLDVSNEAAVVTEPVSRAAFKLYAKIDSDDDDAVIDAIIPAARRMCENYSGINFVARVVTATINNLNGGTYLPYGPIGTVTAVTDVDNNAFTTDGGYQLSGTLFKQLLYPTIDNVTVTYTGGYATCPVDLVNAVKAQALFLYQNRGDSDLGLSPIAQMILNPLKR